MEDSTISTKSEDDFVHVMPSTASEAHDAAEEADVATAAPVKRGEPFSRKDWDSLFLKDGRIADDSRLRKAVFRGGIDPEVRRDVWYFLLGFYPLHSTFREREVILQEKRIEYKALKERWQEELEPGQHEPGADLISEEGDDQFQFMFIQAKLNAMRRVIDEDITRAAMKTIRKDVPRTDRKGEYFAGDDNIHLKWLHDILVTYAAFHPEVGYSQGMNDVLSQILFVIDHEADAYYCFEGYMKNVQTEFLSEGIANKLKFLSTLLEFLDPALHTHLTQIDCGDLIWTHRWLLLGFKREFSFMDSLKLFEILCSHHLELNSIEADKTREVVIRKEREQRMGESLGGKEVHADDSSEKFDFVMFVCMAILRHYRTKLLACKDPADVFTFVNGLVEAMDLDVILDQAEMVFFEYCRKSVSNADASFLLLKT